jgi:hypothetical protein
MAAVLFGLGSAANRFLTKILTAANFSDERNSASLGAIFPAPIFSTVPARPRSSSETRMRPVRSVRCLRSASDRHLRRETEGGAACNGAIVGQKIRMRRVEELRILPS